MAYLIKLGELLKRQCFIIGHTNQVLLSESRARYMQIIPASCALFTLRSEQERCV